MINVDELANEIRRVDGDHALGAGALAEALMPFLEAAYTVARDEALEEAAKVIDAGFPRKGVVKKSDKCDHGRFGWDDCEQCAATAIRDMKGKRG